MFIKTDNLTVDDIAIPVDKMVIAFEKTIFADAITSMQVCGFGIACITDNNMRLKGVITDGDIRRLVLKHQGPLSSTLMEDCVRFASKNPIVFESGSDLSSALRILQENNIWDAPIVKDEKVIGLVHLHHVVGQLIGYSR